MGPGQTRSTDAPPRAPCTRTALPPTPLPPSQLRAPHPILSKDRHFLGNGGPGRQQVSECRGRRPDATLSFGHSSRAFTAAGRHVPCTGVTTAPLKWGFMWMFLGCGGVTGGGVIITRGASIWGGTCMPCGGEGWCGGCRGSSGCRGCCWNRLRMGCCWGGGGGGGG